MFCLFFCDTEKSHLDKRLEGIKTKHTHIHIQGHNLSAQCSSIFFKVKSLSVTLSDTLQKKDECGASLRLFVFVVFVVVPSEA